MGNIMCVCVAGEQAIGMGHSLARRERSLFVLLLRTPENDDDYRSESVGGDHVAKT